MDARMLKTRYAIDIEDLPNPQGMNVVTIAALDWEEYEVKENNKRVTKVRHLLYFAELRLPLRLNNTRVDVLAAMFGQETDHWIGRKVGLYVGAVAEYGETEMKVLLHVQAADHLQAIPPERGSRAAQLPPGAWSGANARAPHGGFAAPPPAPPAGAPFDQRPLGPKGKAKLEEGLASLGATIENVEAWFGQYYPHLLGHIQGKDPHWWPAGVGLAVRSFLTSWPNAPVEAAPSPARAAPAPTPPVVAPPPPPAPQAAQAAATPVPVPAVNFNAGTRPAPARPAAQGPVYEPITEDDIPF